MKNINAYYIFLGVTECRNSVFGKQIIKQITSFKYITCISYSQLNLNNVILFLAIGLEFGQN